MIISSEIKNMEKVKILFKAVDKVEKIILRTKNVSFNFVSC